MATVFATGSGQICIETRGRDILVVTSSGVIDDRMVAFQRRAIELAIGKMDAAAVFVDIEGIVHHTSESRVGVTDIWKPHLPRILTMHVLMDRKVRLVAMAAQVINLALGGICTFERDRASFLDALDRATQISGTQRAGRAVA